MNTAERRAVAALWTIQGVGPVTLHEVSARFGALGPLLERPVREWSAAVPWRADALAHVAALDTLARRADWLEALLLKQGFEIAFAGDPAWPTRLEGIPRAPPLLFLKGPANRAPQRRRLAIVGSRKPEAGSLLRTQRLAMELAERDVGIVSGAAQGIDQAAHHGALDGKGETWAFMGSALDEIDSTQQPVVQRMLANGGTLFSEYPPGFRANSNSFTRRNRLISGSSDATFIARAGLKSGALHTAQAARLQGRPVFAAPGDPWNALAAGTNRLIAQKAAEPLIDAAQLFRALQLDRAVPVVPTPAVDRSALSAPAREVLEVMGPACDFETLVTRCPQLDTTLLASALVELEVLGAIAHRGGRHYEKR